MASDVISNAELEANAIEGVTTDLGPTHVVMVDGLRGDEEPLEVEVILMDWPQALFKHLRHGGAPSWPPGTIWPHVEEETVRQVSSDLVVSAARAWIQEEDVRLSDAYATAVEGPPGPNGPTGGENILHQLLTQMEATASVVTQLQEDMARMKAEPRIATAATAPTGALHAAQQLVGQAPPGRQGQPKMRSMPAPAGGIGALVGEDGEVADDGHPSTDQLVRTALVALLEKQSKKKKGKAPGLPLAQSGSESEGEAEEDPLRRLSGAKGTMLLERLRVSMEAEPQAYVTAMETMAAQILGEAQPGPSTMERYVREQMPLGAEKSLGYMTWGVARAVTALKAGESQKAQLILLLLLSAVEQYKLDASWVAAWRLTHLTSPPFADWRAKESSIHQLRADHSHTRLAHPTWMAAIVARLRDEEVLTKRRQSVDDRLLSSLGYELRLDQCRPTNPPRDRRDLEKGRVTVATAAIRDRLLADFQDWLGAEEQDHCPLAELSHRDPIQVSILVEEYGRSLYEQGAPRRDYAETINVLVQKFPFLKNFLAGPWRLLTTWESLCPSKVHPPMPLPILKALVTTALAWSWTRFALLLLVGGLASSAVAWPMGPL
ncbi:ACT1 [Symbiodinium sp. KB8]|nr:ACT1 [Symbiodinium sp. KB8]